MRISKNIVLAEAAGDYLAVPVGKLAEKNKAVFRLNETAHLIWQGLADGSSNEEIALRLTQEYEIEKTTALTKVGDFIDRLAAAGLLED